MSCKVAVVTGANKGIGLAIVRGLLKRFKGVVYLTARSEERGLAAVAELAREGRQPEFHQLDVSDRASVLRFRDHIAANHGGIDLLVNNAAVANAKQLYNSYEENRETIDINYKGILTVQELLFPLLRDGGRVLNISSDCGHLSNVRNKYWVERLSSKNLTVDDINEFVDEWFLESLRKGTFRYEELADEGTLAAYRVAKVALSALTMLQQRDLAQRSVIVNCVHPGLVRTDMTRGVGFFSVDQAAETPLWLLLDAPASLRGAYVWYDRRVLDWFDHGADYFFKSKTLQG